MLWVESCHFYYKPPICVVTFSTSKIKNYDPDSVLLQQLSLVLWWQRIKAVPIVRFLTGHPRRSGRADKLQLTVQLHNGFNEVV